MKKVAYLITDQNITVNYDGETHIVKRSDALGDRLIKALRENKLNDIPSLISTSKRIETFSKGAFVVKDGRVQVNGVPAPQVLSDKIVRFSNEGLPFRPLLKFAEKLSQNPSFRAVNELYQFLEKNDHPITETGNFIAYKRVRSDFKDIHSGTFDNSVGNVLEVPRNQVDENSARTCSHGLHVANWDYAHTQFGSSQRDTDIMLEVEVNPTDVVAIPSDYNQSKMRVCRYHVLGVVSTPFDPDNSLRVVDRDRFNQDCSLDDDLDEEFTCENCGAEVYDNEPLCTDCEYEESCELCGDHECEGECVEEEEKEDTDRYPFEDEFEDE